jgi:hypothetical protein
MVQQKYHAELLEDAAFIHYWPDIQRLMDAVPETWEDLTKESVYERAMEKSLQVWGVGDSAIRMILFTQIANFATNPALQIIWGAGQERIFERAGDVVDASLEYFAKTQKCKRIDIIGREGWERVLLKRGFKKVAVVLSRRIDEGTMQ